MKKSCSPFTIRKQMKVVEAIVPDNWGIERSFWRGELNNDDSNTGANREENKVADCVDTGKTARAIEINKGELIVKPSFVVIFSDNNNSDIFANVIKLVNKAMSESVLATANIKSCVRVIVGIDELKIAAHTFAKDSKTEIMPWLICLPHLKKMKPSAGSNTGSVSEHKAGKVGKLDNFCPTDFLTLEMRAMTTSVIVFKDDVTKMDACQTIPALYKLYGTKFENLKMFESTMWRILNSPGVSAVELLPGSAEENCIVRKICLPDLQRGW